MRSFLACFRLLPQLRIQFLKRCIYLAQARCKRLSEKILPHQRLIMNTSFDISRDKSLLWLMAIVCGLCAGANYYCQPLISSIQQSFQAPEEQVALTVTFPLVYMLDIN